MKSTSDDLPLLELSTWSRIRKGCHYAIGINLRWGRDRVEAACGVVLLKGALDQSHDRQFRQHIAGLARRRDHLKRNLERILDHCIRRDHLIGEWVSPDRLVDQRATRDRQILRKEIVQRRWQAGASQKAAHKADAFG